MKTPSERGWMLNVLWLIWLCHHKQKQKKLIENVNSEIAVLCSVGMSESILRESSVAIFKGELNAVIY